MRIGIFGGSFDPPHVGHLLAAVDATEQLGLDRLIWVPAARQPLKTEAPHAATPEQRHAMVSLAVAAHPSFRASRIEIDRKGLSYTVTTLEAFAQEYPADDRFLLVGEDAWARFSEWHDPERIRTIARIAVLARSNHGGVGQWAADRGVGDVVPPPAADAPPLWLRTRRVDVSATEIRARVRAGKPIRGFVQDAVAAMIESERLYR